MMKLIYRLFFNRRPEVEISEESSEESSDESSKESSKKFSTGLIFEDILKRIKFWKIDTDVGCRNQEISYLLHWFCVLPSGRKL